jgi:hypothetical protein
LTKERLDKGVTNNEWRNLFPDVGVSVEATTNSDHAMITISLMGQQQIHAHKCRFWYEASWALDCDFQAMLQNAWNS